MGPVETSEPGDSGDWTPLLVELERRRRAAQSMGGSARIARQHAAGRLTARERLDQLFDPGTFCEIGTLVGGAETPADGLVAGSGRIDGRPALAGAEDFTVMGGSIGHGSADKRYRLCQLAAQERVPLVMALEGAGHRLSAQQAGRRPNDLQGLAELSGLVPTVALVLGASAGHGALTVPLCDFSVMTSGASIFSAGPPLVRAATGEDLTKEELGGPVVQVDTSGVVHNEVTDDAAAIALARRYLGHFPSNAWGRAPRHNGDDTGPRRLDSVTDLVPVDSRRPYAMRAVIEMLVDRDSLLEVQPTFGASVITALCFLGGRSVAIVANDPSVRAGAVDRDAADKAARFLDVAGAFHLPVVFLADNPGVMAGRRAEEEGTLRHAARFFAAQHRLRAPKLHVTLRKVFGFGSSVMAMNPFDGQTRSLAFPGATLAAMPAVRPGDGAGAGGGAGAGAGAGAGSGAGGADGADGEDLPVPPWARQAGALSYDDVIDPAELRNALLAGLALSEGREDAPLEPVRSNGIAP